MIPQAAVWIWFGAAWIFIISVLLSRWYRREHEERRATKKAVKRCKADTTNDHIYDA